MLLPTAIRQSRVRQLSLNKSSILHIAGLGILNVCVSMLLLQLSIFYGKASLSAVIMSMNPVFVSFFAAMILKEKLGLVQGISLFFGMLGLMLMLLFEVDFHSTQYRNLSLGICYAIAASLLFGFWTVLTKSAVARFGNMTTNSLSFLFGSAVLFIISALIGRPLLFSASMINICFVAYLGLIITGVAYLLYFEGMKVISATNASAYFMAKPLIAALLSSVILHETLNLPQSAGILLIILSLGIPFMAKLLSFSKEGKFSS